MKKYLEQETYLLFALFFCKVKLLKLQEIKKVRVGSAVPINSLFHQLFKGDTEIASAVLGYLFAYSYRVQKTVLEMGKFLY